MNISERDSGDISARVDAIIEAELRRKLPDLGRVLKQISLECGLSQLDAYLTLRKYRKNGRRVYPQFLAVTGCISLITFAGSAWLLVNRLTGNQSYELGPDIILGICLIAVLIVSFLKRLSI